MIDKILKSLFVITSILLTLSSDRNNIEASQIKINIEKEFEKITESQITESEINVKEPMQETSESENLEETIEPEFVTVDETGTLYATTSVNIRKFPFVESDKVGLLLYGQKIEKTGICNNGWTRVNYNNDIAYINSKYLSDIKPEPELKYNGIIQKIGNVSEKLLFKMDSYYYKIPENIRNSFENNGWKIYATDEHLGQKFFNTNSSILAVTTDIEDAIYLHNREDSALALIHEMGHYIDFASGYVSYTSEFADIFREEVEIFKSVHSTHENNTINPMEYFAEFYQELIINPSKVENICPKTKEFILKYANSL